MPDNYTGASATSLMAAYTTRNGLAEPQAVALAPELVAVAASPVPGRYPRLERSFRRFSSQLDLTTDPSQPYTLETQGEAGWKRALRHAHNLREIVSAAPPSPIREAELSTLKKFSRLAGGGPGCGVVDESLVTATVASAEITSAIDALCEFLASLNAPPKKRRPPPAGRVAGWPFPGTADPMVEAHCLLAFAAEMDLEAAEQIGAAWCGPGGLTGLPQRAGTITGARTMPGKKETAFYGLDAAGAWKLGHATGLYPRTRHIHMAGKVTYFTLLEGYRHLFGALSSTRFCASPDPVQVAAVVEPLYRGGWTVVGSDVTALDRHITWGMQRALCDSVVRHFTGSWPSRWATNYMRAEGWGVYAPAQGAGAPVWYVEKKGGVASGLLTTGLVDSLIMSAIAVATISRCTGESHAQAVRRAHSGDDMYLRIWGDDLILATADPRMTAERWGEACKGIATEAGMEIKLDPAPIFLQKHVGAGAAPSPARILQNTFCPERGRSVQLIARVGASARCARLDNHPLKEAARYVKGAVAEAVGLLPHELGTYHLDPTVASSLAALAGESRAEAERYLKTAAYGADADGAAAVAMALGFEIEGPADLGIAAPLLETDATPATARLARQWLSRLVDLLYDRSHMAKRAASGLTVTEYVRANR